MNICKICNSKITNKLGAHLSKHKIKSKDYFDKFNKVAGCLSCGNDTRFLSLGIGYKKYCSNKCQLKYEYGNKIRDPKAWYKKVGNIGNSKENNDKKRESHIKRKYNKISNIKDISPMFEMAAYNGSKEGLKRTSYNFKCDKCNSEFEDTVADGHLPRCYKCQPKFNGTSKIEKEFQDYISNIIKTKNNKRFFENGKYKYELDVYIPSLNI